jgi:hypothetical protein
MLHWIVERGDDGIDAMHANQSKQMTRTFDRARGTAMEVPEAIAGEITASFDGVDATKAASNFSNICGEVGCGDLYWVYGILSQSVHPSVSTSNAYIEPESGALRLTPRLGYPASVGVSARDPSGFTAGSVFGRAWRGAFAIGGGAPHLSPARRITAPTVLPTPAASLCSVRRPPCSASSPSTSSRPRPDSLFAVTGRRMGRPGPSS